MNLDDGSAKPTRVFLSYAWEDESYRNQVKALAVRLREDGIDVRLDVWHAHGLTIPEFMSRESRHADRILILCSPAYQRKAHALEDGEKVSGVGWEHMLVTSSIWAGWTDRTKLVVCLFRGEWQEAAPAFLSALPFIDLRSQGKQFEAAYRDLLRLITGRTERAPELGPPPEGLDFDPIAPLRGTEEALGVITRPPRRRLILSGSALVTSLASAWWLTRPTTAPCPISTGEALNMSAGAVTLSVELLVGRPVKDEDPVEPDAKEVFRGSVYSMHTSSVTAAIPPKTPFRLRLLSSQPGWVRLFTHEMRSGGIAGPSRELERGLWLEAGHPTLFPPQKFTHQDDDVLWFDRTADTPEAEVFVFALSQGRSDGGALRGRLCAGIHARKSAEGGWIFASDRWPLLASALVRWG